MNPRALCSNPTCDPHTARFIGADGTLIRHFLLRLASTIGPLPVRMVPSSVETALMLALVFAALPQTGLMPAGFTAVELSAVTRLADEERHSTAFVATETPVKNDRFGSHLDSARRWTTAAGSCEARPTCTGAAPSGAIQTPEPRPFPAAGVRYSHPDN